MGVGVRLWAVELGVGVVVVSLREGSCCASASVAHLACSDMHEFTHAGVNDDLDGSEENRAVLFHVSNVARDRGVTRGSAPAEPERCGYDRCGGHVCCNMHVAYSCQAPPTGHVAQLCATCVLQQCVALWNRSGVHVSVMYAQGPHTT